MNTSTEATEIESTPPSPNMPLAWMIGFYFAFRVSVAALTNWAIGLDPQVGAGLTLVLNFALLLATAFTCMGERRGDRIELLSLPPIRWVLFFLVFSGCSLLWSVAVSLPAAAGYWCSLAADSVMVALLLRKYRTEDVANAMMRGVVWGSCLFAVLAWFSPPQEDNRLGFDILGANQIGFSCAFGLFAAQFLTIRKQGKWTAAIVVLAVTLLRSLSKTTIIALLAGEAFLLLRERSIPRRVRVLTSAGALLLVLLFWNFLSSYYAFYADTNQAENLSGRLGIWTYMLSEGIEKPWIGHGFHSVWKVIPPFPPDDFEARHAHNEVIQQFYTYGAVGVVMMAGLYISLFRQTKKMPRGALRTFLFSLLIFSVIRGLADTEPFDLTFPLWAMLLFGALTAAQTSEAHVLSSVETTATLDLPEAAHSLQVSN